ncbi:hypothetical protein MCOR27_001288 [Pyricularia oryzae]|uniref:Uncharacterized protein n=2 Tax=Pyricularia TaxID=48558 RepID=A0ABQ8NTK2_PYRGI|nr:hypothetical protein MCOR26_003557 [Pyricularia oryzae]KAI6301863.1 hypothetical protein MCOR33_002703 [Pyricularia grisea]KAI6287721.1 hypothetical protein MCOR27_001288 [Pyricularia oryzae]KAI6350605.1 hypothetical protein MCOR28_000154 [Pyricularia oryzae]KAI6417241.1 hypothetical protein MCOR20_000425 [Pyricularia oryzae]
MEDFIENSVKLLLRIHDFGPQLVFQGRFPGMGMLIHLKAGRAVFDVERLLRNWWLSWSRGPSLARVSSQRRVNLTNIEETIRKAQFDGRQLRNTVAVTLGLARAACEDGCGDGKLTQEYLKMEFNSVAAFQKDFRFQMEFCKDAQNGMAKQLRTRGNGWCGG